MKDFFSIFNTSKNNNNTISVLLNNSFARFSIMLNSFYLSGRYAQTGDSS